MLRTVMGLVAFVVFRPFSFYFLYLICLGSV
uniref:Uncharacterized protein n=1 Tax=Rhizophora mucronata TaxID=61149 RepID=A0A2P2PJ23_RHIMU